MIAAPAASVGHNSQTEASNPVEASIVMRSRGPRPDASVCHAVRCMSAACETATPFGLPVEPDV
jgi:hypothetical protein